MNKDTTNSIVPSNGSPLEYIFEGKQIRVLKDENGEPLFIAADVCKVLELDNVTRALARIDDDEKGLTTSNTPGGAQTMLYVNESGLYTLILTSRKDEAKAFKRWITHEVIPAIRKTGGYIAPLENLSPLQQARVLLNSLVRMQDALENQEARLDNHATRITQLEEHVQPEVEYYTVVGYFRKRGLTPPTMNEAQSIGQRATRLSRIKSYGIGKTSDPRFGEVNTYHVDILREVVDRE